MKKLLIFILVIFISLMFLIGCEKAPEKGINELSELQIDACNAADEAGTCNTKLEELGIVLKEDCCNALGKCC